MTPRPRQPQQPQQPQQPRPTRYLGQRLLMTLILWYRRRLSGRGPLARVRCTFAHTESCSAYGLRMTKEARNLLEALRLILGRIRRCGAASLYELPEGLSWGEAYDNCEPAVLDTQLRTSHETRRTRALMHRSAGLIAVRCGHTKDAREHLTRAAALCDPSPRPCVRRTKGLARALRARLWRRLLLLSAIALALGLQLTGPAQWIALGAVIALALTSTAIHRQRTRRHDNLAAASAFSPPPEPS